MKRRAKRRGQSQLTALGSLVRTVGPVQGHVDSVKVFGFWERALPERIRRNARPIRLERGTLLVHVTSPAWAQELSFHADKLVARIRAFAPEAKVHKIFFRVGPLPEVPAAVRRQRAAEYAGPVPLSEIPEEIGRALASLRDDEVREAVQKAVVASLSMERERERGGGGRK